MGCGASVHTGAVTEAGPCPPTLRPEAKPPAASPPRLTDAVEDASTSFEEHEESRTTEREDSGATEREEITQKLAVELPSSHSNDIPSLQAKESSPVQAKVSSPLPVEAKASLPVHAKASLPVQPQETSPVQAKASLPVQPQETSPVQPQESSPVQANGPSPVLANMSPVQAGESSPAGSKGSPVQAGECSPVLPDVLPPLRFKGSPSPIRSQASDISIEEVSAIEKTPIAMDDVAFPVVEVSHASRIMLLTWARCGRNAKRRRDEILHESRRSRPRPQVIPRPMSQQPTPCQTPREEPHEADAKGATPSEEKLPLTAKAERQPHRNSKTLSTEDNDMGDRRSVGSRATPSQNGLFADLRGAQVRAMQSQGVRHKLSRSLPEEVGRANTVGPNGPGFGQETPGFGKHTPGFGQETPNFPGKSRTTDSSRAPSGVQSVMAQSAVMSPWLFADTADSPEPVDCLASIDEDGATSTAFNLSSLKESLDESPLGREEVEVPQMTRVPSFDDLPLPVIPKAVRPEPVTPRDPVVAGVYPVGSVVLYFSKSRMRWMKGVVMDMVRGLYLIDKGFGCHGKCNWSQIMNDADKKLQVYRLIDLLDGIPLPTRHAGPLVKRDDFSSDEDD